MQGQRGDISNISKNEEASGQKEAASAVVFHPAIFVPPKNLCHGFTAHSVSDSDFFLGKIQTSQEAQIFWRFGQ